MPIAKAWRPLSWIGKELRHIQEKELYKERTYQFFSEYREHYLADLRKNLSDAKLFANRSALFANDAESAMIACSLL